VKACDKTPDASLREVEAEAIEPSCPALCRASTSSRTHGRKDVDGRVKPGHDDFGNHLIFQFEELDCFASLAMTTELINLS
jgi:hypothetical protein